MELNERMFEMQQSQGSLVLKPAERPGHISLLMNKSFKCMSSRSVSGSLGCV